MGQIIVRNLDDRVIERLKARARDKGQSLEQTVREELDKATKPGRDSLMQFSADMRKTTAGRKRDIDVVAAIRHDRASGHGRKWL